MKLAPNHIHLWKIPLNFADHVNEQVAFFYQFLPYEEQERADRFIFDRHRRRFILAHFALRKILGNYLNLSPENVEFEVLSHGKPQLVQRQNSQHIEFNLSHSGETALVGLRTEKVIGVDIEYHCEREFLGIASHVFSDKECQALENIQDKQQKTQSFFHIWAQKEAFIKAIGKGLSYPLKDFSVSPQMPAELIETVYENKSDWFFHSFQPVPNAHAAIATLHPIDNIIYFDFNFNSR